MKAANEIVKNNQTGTYVIDDMCEAMEEIKVVDSQSPADVRPSRAAGALDTD